MNAAAAVEIQGSIFVAQVTVVDPITGLPCDVEIRRLDDGTLVGLDAAFLERSDVDPISPYDGHSFRIPEDELGSELWQTEEERRASREALLKTERSKPRGCIYPEHE
jgi:hypothetical protein